MSYSQGINASAATQTRSRTTSTCPFSGMCVTCVEGCIGFCEVGKSALRGREAIYPEPFGRMSTASQKRYPVDLSHFNIMGTMQGALGLKSGPDASFLSADTSVRIGKAKPIKGEIPVIVSAMGSTRVAQNNWEGLAVGCAISGVPLTIGENVCGMDPGAEFVSGRVKKSPELASRVRLFREWQGENGAIVVQENVEDRRHGVLEYAIEELGVETVEVKWGQGAKCIGGEVKVDSIETALMLKNRGYIVIPDPEDPLVCRAFRNGVFREFERHSMMGTASYDAFLERVEFLRRVGAKNVFLKTGAYRPLDLALAVKCASDGRIDLLTVDGAGGGTGMSPWRMMNEWGIPTVYLSTLLFSYLNEVANQKRYVPDVAIAGGFILEDQVLKGIALGAPYVKAIGMARAPLTAVMVGSTLGRLVMSGNVPKQIRNYGEDLEHVFSSYTLLQDRYGGDLLELHPSAIALYTYFDRLKYGLQQFMGGLRKFSLEHVSREDIAALTEEASSLTGISHMVDLDRDAASAVLKSGKVPLRAV